MVMADNAGLDPPATDFFQANLEAFKRWAPRLHGRLAAVKAPNSQLVVDPAGRVDMSFLGQGFYRGDATADTTKQIDRYFAKPQRQTISEPNPDNLAGSCGDLCIALTDRLAEEGIAYDGANAPEDSEFLLVFGVGLGLHVEPLIERTAPRLVVLIEPNLEFIYHSLFVVDWQAVLEAAEVAGRKISFVVEREPTAIANKVAQTLRANNPALLDGLYLYSHYPSVILEQAKDRIRQHMFLALAGLGFFEDELVMTRNAAANLARAPVGILSDYHAVRPESVFIVGSGPSVQADLDFIAAHAGRAVVISIGTGLRVLLNRGIRPDFHVELENALPTVRHLSEIAATFGLEGITLIASATVQPAVPEMFEDRILFFREVVSSSALFGGFFQILKPAGPTVANTALIAAIRLGFREIYAFGVDMGSKAEGRFHADGSVYSTGLIDDYATATLSFPGNFGGQASGEAILNWSRSVLENVLVSHRSVRLYNCSDGVRIAGARPKVARAIELPADAIDGAALKRNIAGALRVFTAKLLQDMWDGDTRLAEVEAVFDRLEAALLAAGDDPDQGIGWIHELFEIVGRAGEESAVTKAYLTGTTLLIIGCVRWYDRRLSDAGARTRYREIAAQLVLETFRDLRRQLSELIGETDERLSAVG